MRHDPRDHERDRPGTRRRGGGWDWDTRNERKTTNVNVDTKKTV